MCKPSVVTNDWVTKGCHIHIDGVELNIFANHLGTIEFRAVFSKAPKDDVARAIKIAWEKCLPDPEVRKRWIKRLESARIYMLDYQGVLSPLANGRMLDFKFIRIAIERLGKKYDDS